MRCISQAVCLVLGSILGTGCHSPVHPAPEYGMPNARYRLDGVVTARPTGRPIPGIRFFLSRDERPDSSAVTTSGADGSWRLDTTALPCGDGCGVVASDVDGPENGGSFTPTTVPLRLTQTGRGDGHWDHGTFEQHGISVSLDPQARNK